MKQKKVKCKRRNSICLFICSLMVLFLASCQDDKKDTEAYDPSQPVVFTEFSPTEGALRTRLYIYGSNFGKDLSKIHINIGGQDTKVIGSNGHSIYCMIPRRAFTGEVNVKIKNDSGETIVDYTFEKKFNYQSKIQVSTLCGKVDELGNSAMKDGDFSEAQFTNPYWLAIDKYSTDRTIYLTEQNLAVRKLDLDNEKASTVITNGQGSFTRMQTLTFHPDGDTLFVSDDNGRNDDGAQAIAYLLRSKSFKTANPYVYDKASYSCAIHPIDKGIYYNVYQKAAILQAKAYFDEGTQKWKSKEIFKIIENDREGYPTYLTFHPEGKYLYATGFKCVFKCEYKNKTLQPPYTFAGTAWEEGYKDGMGSNARFSDLAQGVFVKNEDYVNAGKEDVYDFYVCDMSNHCIRKITPEGIVTTYAGRGSESSDSNYSGYIDGDLRKEARFNQPSGLAYDEEDGTFYIADYGNKRIRFIAVE